MLKPVKDIAKLKLMFFTKFWSLQNENPLFMQLLSKIREDHNVYVVGGFIRDIINNRQSRDIDMVFDITQEKLMSALEDSNLSYKINRMSGVKILLNNFEADMWTLKNNWAFKSKVIKRNEDKILDNIADGCFYNYDSLVIDINSGNLRAKYYNECVVNKKLDILKKSIIYKERNPTVAANILRALYLNKLHDIGYSDNCMVYIAKKTLKVSSNFNESVKQINLVKTKYPKYSNVLSDEEVFQELSNLLRKFDALNKIGMDNSQISLNLNGDD